MPHEKTPAELLAEGDAYYQHGQYQRANTAYLAAFEFSRDSNDVTPLDKAAACYLRMKDYNSALCLTKKMSKLNAGDVRVYLRMGQTLQLLQKTPLATKIYAKGLERCPITANGYDALRKQYNLLESQERATKSGDPVQVLPFEMLDHIMGYLDFKCRVKLLRLSKKWRSYLIGNSFLWTDLDLSLSRRQVSQQCIANYIKWSDGRMHTARVKRLAQFRSLWELGRQCQITSLFVLDNNFPTTSITHPLMVFKNLQSLTISNTDVTLDIVEVLLRQVPSLVSLEVEQINSAKQELTWDFDLPDLQHLKIRFVEHSHRHFLRKLHAQLLIERIPNIRTLALLRLSGADPDLDFSGLARLETLDLGQTFFGLGIDKLPVGLRSLHFSVSDHDFAPDFEPNLPRLESLALHLSPLHRSLETYLLFLLSFLDQPVDGCFYEPGSPALRKLSIKPCPSGSMWKRILGAPRVERLEEIEMIGLKDIEEAFMCGLIVDRLQHLKRLQIKEFYSLTGWGVKQLVTGLPHLEELVLSECPKVQFDAIEWARKKLKRVGWTPLPEAKSGKKVLW